MIKTILKNCLYCQQTFNAPIKEINRGNGKFCSRQCSSRFSSKNKTLKSPNCKCYTCKKDFYRSPSRQRIAKHGYQFCSRKCKEKAQTINSIHSLPIIFPSHYNNGIKIKYRIKAFKKLLNKCNRCNYDKVIKILQVHHIDRNRENNDINNLEILCPTCHYEEHYLKRDGVFWNTP